MPFTPVKSESSICPYQGGVFNILQLNLCLLLAPWIYLDDTYPSDPPAQVHMYTSQTILAHINGLTLLELSKINFSYWVWQSLQQVLLLESTTRLWKTEALIIHYHMSKRRKIHLLLIIFCSISSQGFGFFSPRLQRSWAGQRDRRHCRHLPPASLRKMCTAGCLVQDRCLSVKWGLISVNQSLLFYTSCPFIQKSPEGS